MTRHELIQRQQQLLTRSAELRAAIRVESGQLEKPLAVIDKARQSIHWLTQHPEWPLGAGVALLILKPRRALAWTGRIWWAWKTVKRVKKLIDT